MLLCHVTLLGETTATYQRDYFPFCTIRHTACHIMIPSTSAKRCNICAEHRKVLHSLHHRHIQRDQSAILDQTDPLSHTNYKFLSEKEKDEHLHLLHSKNRLNSQRINRLTENFEKEIKENGIEVDSAFHEDLVAIMEREEHRRAEEHRPGSFQRLFLEQQHKAAKLSNSKSMRWAPVMIKWLALDACSI